jgi:hypothetical protein
MPRPYAELRNFQSASGTCSPAGRKPSAHDSVLATERHYTPQELADTWGLAPDTIRELFESEPGVMVIDRNGTRNKRRYRTFRIPESVAARVHRRYSAG